MEECEDGRARSWGQQPTNVRDVSGPVQTHDLSCQVAHQSHSLVHTHLQLSLSKTTLPIPVMDDQSLRNAVIYQLSAKVASGDTAQCMTMK